jgi:hypothetical protein
MVDLAFLLVSAPKSARKQFWFRSIGGHTNKKIKVRCRTVNEGRDYKSEQHGAPPTTSWPLVGPKPDKYPTSWTTFPEALSCNVICCSWGLPRCRGKPIHTF